ncbi:MAG: Hemolysin, chromosomal [Verrucomicrobiota bacterium]
MKPKFSRTTGLTAAFTACFCLTAAAQITFNTANDGGTWGNSSNWTPATVPNATDAEAIVNGVGPSGTSPATTAMDVLLDGNYIIGKLKRSVAGAAATFPTTPVANDPTKGLTLATSTGTPTIDVVGDVFYYSSLFGTQGFEKTGAGRFTFRFNGVEQNYTGTVKISAGTLGIQTDRNLGDLANNIEIGEGARLFAEPGSNSGTLTLAATRSITLLGAGQFGSNAAAVNFLIESSISDGGNGFGPVKTDAGVVTLAGTNSWTGSTVINAGVLSATKPEALPGYDTQTYNVNGTSTLAIRFGDASTWTSTEIEGLLANASFASAASFGLDTTGNVETAILAGDLTVANLSKVGPGNLVISDPQTSISSISLYGGSLEIGEAGGLPSDVIFKNLSSGSIFNLGGTTASFADLQEIGGGTTTVTHGDLTYTGGTITFGGNSGTTLDLSGLSSYTHSSSGTELKLETTNNLDPTTNTVLFSGGTNTITVATRMLVGGGTSAGNGPHVARARLGTTNTINSSSLQLGAFNSSGVVNFQDGLTDPSLKLRGADGTSAMTLLRVGETTSGVRSGAGTLDLTGGSADILATDILVGRHGANSNNGNTSTLTIPNGTVTATTLKLAQKQGSGTPAIIGTVNQSGGTVSLTNLVMVETLDSSAPNVASATQNLRANYNLSGGTLTVAEIKPGSSAIPITAGTTQRNLILIGGILRNQEGADLAIRGVTFLVAGDSSTTVESSSGQKVVLASDVSYSARMNSANGNAGALTVTGHLDLTSAPAFSIFDDAVTAAALPAGTKLRLIDYNAGVLTGEFAGLADGATVSVTKGEITNEFIIDYNDPAFGGKAVTLTIPGASAANFASWASENNVTGGASGDSDNDSVANLVEYALALNPSGSDGSVGSFTGGTLSFQKRAEAVENGDVVYAIQTSSDLVTWTDVPATSDTPSAITYALPAGGSKSFTRLKVVLNN